MLFGLAIVTRPVAAIPEIVQHGVNGWLEPSLDPGAFAEDLRRLADDRELLRMMARANRETAVRRFTPEVVKERLRAIYSSLVPGQCAA
jgi:glycosyltransferase involved in cell wall biosynthesis